MTSTKSITESPSELTTEIDRASPIEIVRMLRQTDAQIFSGYLGYPGLFDRETITTIAKLAARLAQTLKAKNGRVILSGAGTSGRLAMLGARMFNQESANGTIPNPAVRFLIAGGYPALIQAQEGAEDDPHQGIKDLEAAIEGAADVFYVGITCGMSAPYIAGQLEFLLGKPNAHAVLMGFNPIELARDTPIENWKDTFRETAIKTEAASNGTVLNPVVGPEPITGSTRMKSGSATKILIEILFIAADTAVKNEKFDEGSLCALISAQLKRYESAATGAYKNADQIAQLVSEGAKTLRSGGHIYYFGDTDTAADVNTVDAGILGLIDASECPPTYGARFEDVRGFLRDGWKALLPGAGVDLSNLGANFAISFEDFASKAIPALTKNDLCVYLCDFPARNILLRQAAFAGAKTALILLGEMEDSPADLVVSIHEFPPDVGAEFYPKGTFQLQIKLVLNALTTGAHILTGKVFGNRMVDLRISNNKLFHRTVGIIGDLMKVTPEEARLALLCSIYRTDKLTDGQLNAPISSHIEMAKSVEKVVPKALLLATGKFSCEAAASALVEEPVVRTALEKFVTNGSPQKK